MTHSAETVHANSRASFAALDVNERQSLVMAAYLLANAPLTDRDVARRIGTTELNDVRPRVSELVGKSLLWECGSVKCEVSGRKVRVCIPTSLARKGTT